MLDYLGLAALAAVVREGSFERAAQKLHVTPSAVSQRIKQLEERTGQVLVQRGSPCTGTEAGRRLCLHLEQVALLENALRRSNPDLLPDAPVAPTIRLAVNADSLSIWFMDAMAEFTEGGNELLDLRVDDQDHTAQALREGAVLGAVTATGSQIPGCNSWPLGTMRYVAAASPDFVARYFAGGVTAQALARAPIMTFDRKDQLPDQWMQAHGLAPRHSGPRHFLPTNYGYVRACEIGMGWGTHPVALIAEQLERGSLVELMADTPLDVPLFWALPRSAQTSLARLTDCVMRAAAQALAPP